VRVHGDEEEEEVIEEEERREVEVSVGVDVAFWSRKRRAMSS
jgi:deoxyinosine 3'endonuclease (endonuclease V)